MKLRHWIALGVVVSFIGVVGFGLWLARRTRPPARAQEVVVVHTLAEGLSALEVEERVTRPVEDALTRVDGITGMQSTSRAGSSIIELRLAFAANSLAVMEAVQTAASQAQSSLPVDVSPPYVMRVARHDTRWIWVKEPDAALAQRLEAVPNVRAVTVCGRKRRELRIVLDENALASRSIVPDDVASALLLAPPTLLVRSPLDDIAKKEIKNGTIVADVATIETTESTQCEATRGGASGVLVGVEVGPDYQASDAKIRAEEGASFGFDKDAFRVEFGRSGMKAADVDRMAREAGAKDAIVLEKPGIGPYQAIVIASDICSVAVKLEQSLAAKKVPVNVLACDLDDDDRAVRFVGPDLDTLATAARDALDLASSHGAVGFIEGDEKESWATLPPDASREDRTALRQQLRLRGPGIEVGTTAKDETVVIALPRGEPKLAHFTHLTTVDGPSEIRHVNTRRTTSVRITGEDAHEHAQWVARRVKPPSGVLVLTR